MDTILTTLQTHWVVLLIPPIAGFIGWFTNLVAVRMMFYPTHFVGIPPYLGWQGIVPASAHKLAKVTTRLITTKLIQLPDLFQSFTGAGFLKHMGPVIERITDQVIAEIASKYAPEMWAALDESAQASVRAVVRAEVEATATEILDELGRNIEAIVDLETIVTDTIVADRALMSRLFLDIGAEEFKFIERSGWWFGLLFGIPQMIVWVLYPAWWTLPLAGFFVGYATNWVAIKLIFEPREPKRFGPVVVQGLFHKRQAEVAKRFAELSSKLVLYPENIVKYAIQGSSGDVLWRILDKHLDALWDKYTAHPMAAMVLPEAKREAARAELIARVRAELPAPGGFLHTFAKHAVDVQDELFSRMASLDPQSFEGVLRPAFQQDEWKLIVAGAILGAGAGMLQVIYLFGDMLL